MNINTNRRSFLKTIAGVVTACGADSYFAQNVFAANRRVFDTKPNIVFILVDDLGYNFINANGGTHAKGEAFFTPRIDSIAKQGVRFTHGHSRAMCGPSRQVMITGKTIMRFGNHPSMEDVYLPQYLKEAGYATGISGKWMMGPLMNPKLRGFDEGVIYCGKYEFWNPALMVFNSGGYLKEYNQPSGIERVKGGEYNLCKTGEPGCATIFKDQFGPTIINSFATDFIERHNHHPFFLYYPLKMTHVSYPKLPGSNEEGSYASAITYADNLVGNILDKLDTAGIRDNTLVIFAGDNGHSCYQDEINAGHWCIPGKKGGVREGATRVPFIVSYKRKGIQGAVCDDLVDFTDILPTCLEVAGIPVPTNTPLDGRSFAPQILGAPPNPREWMYIHAGHHPTPLMEELSHVYSEAPAVVRYVIGTRYKLYGDGRFYDLQDDIEENNPIPLGIGTARAEELRKKLQQVLNTYDDRALWARDKDFIEPTIMEKVKVGILPVRTHPLHYKQDVSKPGQYYYTINGRKVTGGPSSTHKKASSILINPNRKKFLSGP